MPGLSKAKEIAKRIVCSNNQRGLGLANTIYAQDHDGWYVPCMDWTGLISTNWPNNPILRDLIGYKDAEDETEGWHAPKKFQCPSDLVSKQEMIDEENGYESYLSYGYNVTDWFPPGVGWDDLDYVGHRNTFVRNPSGEAVWGESNDWWMRWSGANYVIGWDVLGHDTISPYKLEGCDGPTLYRHSEGAVFTFYDGHVEYMKKDKVWIQENWDNNFAGMWSTFNPYPPTVEDISRIPTP